MSFMNELKNQSKTLNNQTFTENGDLAVVSTLNSNLDFFGLSGSMSNCPQILTLFKDSFEEDPILAIKNLFYLRDIREGNGRRKTFREILKYIAKFDKKILQAIIQYIPEIGRWDDINELIAIPNVSDFVLEFIQNQIKVDLNNLKQGQPISLIGKWLPSQNTSSEETRKLAKIIIKKIYKGNAKKYRKDLSLLRKEIKIVESNLTEKRYDFDYVKLPARALMKYTKAFNRNDKKRYKEFKESLAENKINIASKTQSLYPYEIMKKLQQDEMLADSLWGQMMEADNIHSNKRFLVVRDGSRSMLKGVNNVIPLDVADSLSIYMSSKLSGEFKDKFITFSENPLLVDLSSYSTLSQKVDRLHDFRDIANTNIEKTYNLIFNTSLQCKKEDYLDGIIIISDMEFDQGARYNVSTYDAIKEKFNQADIPFPKMIYWNVNAKKMHFPTTDIDNAVFVSGYSKNLFKDIMTGEILNQNAVTFMKDVLSKYDYLDESLSFLLK